MSTELIAIVGVGVSLAALIYSGMKDLRADFREVRNDMNRLQERVTGLEGSLRERMAWVEGLLGAFTNPPDTESVFKWRGLRQTEPKEQD